MSDCSRLSDSFEKDHFKRLSVGHQESEVNVLLIWAAFPRTCKTGEGHVQGDV